MKFLHRPVQDFEGITRNFEQLETIFSGLNAVRFGTATITWDGINKFSTGTTVTHGLGVIPAVLFGSGVWGTRDFAVGFSGANAATVVVYGDVLGAAVPAASTDTVYWLALG